LRSDSTCAFLSPLQARDNRNYLTHIPADLRNTAKLVDCLRDTSLSFAASPPQQPPWTADTRLLGRRPSTRCPLTATLTTQPRLARRAIALLCACSPRWKSPMTPGRMSYRRFLSLPLFRCPLFLFSHSSQCTRLASTRRLRCLIHSGSAQREKCQPGTIPSLLPVPQLPRAHGRSRPQKTGCAPPVRPAIPQQSDYKGRDSQSHQPQPRLQRACPPFRRVLPRGSDRGSRLDASPSLPRKSNLVQIQA
jgi:hypothetical protein